MGTPLVYEAYRHTLIGALVLCARARGTLTYTAVVACARLPLNLQSNPVHRSLLNDWLTRLMIEEDLAGLPLLSSLVVRSTTGLPGPGYFNTLVGLGRCGAEEDVTESHARELRAVHAFYSGSRGLIEARVVPERDRELPVIMSRPARFYLMPLGHQLLTTDYLLLHTGLSSENHAGEFVTPEWFTGTWEVFQSIWAYRFVLEGNSTFWRLAGWTPEGGRRVRIRLEPDRTVLDVRKAREYPDGSCAFEVLFSDGAKTWGKVRRRNGALNFFDHDYHREGWPEPPFEMIAAAFESKIPG